MDKQLRVTYHYNSGFSVRIGSTLFVFDYWEGENGKLSQAGSLNQTMLSAFENVYVFVSHAHPDHYSKVITQWKSVAPVSYIVSFDMPVGTFGKRIMPLDNIVLSQDIRVKAFESTDQGVSFLVNAYGLSIFHAGDLNLWHWRQESSLREIEAAENAFYKALEPIKGEKIDLAMFPVDPRQGAMYDAGANHFILMIKPRIFVPMHWQDRPEVAYDFARRSKTSQTTVLALTKPGEQATITFAEKTLDIHIIEPPKDLSELAAVGSMKLETPDTEEPTKNPFEDTDLPVNFDEDE